MHYNINLPTFKENLALQSFYLVSDKELFLFGSSLTLISDGLRSGNPSDRPGQSCSGYVLVYLES